MSSEERVSDIMDSKVETTKPDVTAGDCAKAMAKGDRGYAVVVEGTLAVGIVTERDLVQKVIAEGLDPSKVLVGDIMSTPLVKVSSDSSVDDAAQLMADYGIRKVVVIDPSGGLAGIVTAEAFAKILASRNNFSDPKLNALANAKADSPSSPYQ
ncbi:MAG TPA: CBS domain-containing protein [Nitrososphaerales archaeon]|nr:CBS domain-containing protein [Nitrososphaerales archaeon]